MKRFLISIETVLGKFYGRILENSGCETHHLQIFRMFFGMYLLLFSPPSYSWIAGAPEGFFNPPILSIAAFFEGFPPPPLLKAVDLAVIVLIFFLALGVKARLCGFLLFVFHVIFESFSLSFGKIDHGFLVWVTLFCLSLTNWGCGRALVKDRMLPEACQRWALGLLAFFICFSMFTAGCEKLLRWVDFDTTTSGFLLWFYGGYYDLGRVYLAAPLVFKIPPQWFEIMDYGAVVFELSPLFFLLAGKRMWRGWLVTACGFHLMTTLLLNITFMMHALIYGVYIFDFGRTSKREASKDGPPAIALAAAGILTVFHLTKRLWGEGNGLFYLADAEKARILSLNTAAVVWIIVFCGGCFSLMRESRKVTA